MGKKKKIGIIVGVGFLIYVGIGCVTSSDFGKFPFCVILKVQFMYPVPLDVRHTFLLPLDPVLSGTTIFSLIHRFNGIGALTAARWNPAVSH